MTAEQKPEGMLQTFAQARTVLGLEPAIHVSRRDRKRRATNE